MKSLKLIECRNFDNDVAETLLPTLSDKEMGEIAGGLYCGENYANGPDFCTARYSVTVCAMWLSCGYKFNNGNLNCKEEFTNKYDCYFYNGD